MKNKILLSILFLVLIVSNICSVFTIIETKKIKDENNRIIKENKKIKEENSLLIQQKDAALKAEADWFENYIDLSIMCGANE